MDGNWNIHVQYICIYVCMRLYVALSVSYPPHHYLNTDAVFLRHRHLAVRQKTLII